MTEYSKRRIVDEIIGWYGASAIVLAYIFVSFHVFFADSIMYQLLNFTGAMGIVYISFKKNAYQPGVLNIIWAIVALIALIRIFLIWTIVKFY